MRIRYPVGFEPITQEWAPYTQHVLSKLLGEPVKSATLTFDRNAGAFALKAEGFQTCYFKLRDPVDLHDAIMARWAVDLGHEMLLCPHVEVSKGKDQKITYFLAALLNGSDPQVGLFRACAKLVRCAEQLPVEGVNYMRSLADSVKE